jgi:hypothetical protein
MQGNFWKLLCGRRLINSSAVDLDNQEEFSNFPQLIREGERLETCS